MPKNLHLELTDDQRCDLRELLGRRDLARHTRLRAECVRLLDRGRTVTKVAGLLECNPVTVRAAGPRSLPGLAARTSPAGRARGRCPTRNIRSSAGSVTSGDGALYGALRRLAIPRASSARRCACSVRPDATVRVSSSTSRIRSSGVM